MERTVWRIVSDADRLIHISMRTKMFSCNIDGTINPLRVCPDSCFTFNERKYKMKKFKDMETKMYFYLLVELYTVNDDKGISGYQKAVDTGKMMIHIKDNVSRYTTTCEKQYANKINSLAGQWVLVDTDNLFQASFNAKIPNAEAVNGYQLFAVSAQLVDCVVNDMRKGRKRCEYCGRHSVYKDKLGRYHMKCPYCNREGAFTVFDV